MKKNEHKYVFVKYSADPPYLPEVVADNLEELAEKLGTTYNSVKSSVYHQRAGFKKNRHIRRLHLRRKNDQ